MLNVAPPDTEELIQSMLPPTAVLLNDFGMTEAAGMVTFTPVTDSPDDRLRTNGVPFPGLEIRITGEDGVTELPVGEEGEIQFRGPNAMSGYLNDPEATARTIIDGGWVRTGDRGRLDDRGHLVYVGRIKEMLKVGGENVAPAEVEMLLSTHPAVAMAQVVGKPDAKYGEVAGRVRRAAARAHRDRGGARRPLPRPDRELQAPARGPVRHRVADVGHEDPEVPAARAAGRRGGDGDRRLLSVRRSGAPRPARAVRP